MISILHLVNGLLNRQDGVGIHLQKKAQDFNFLTLGQIVFLGIEGHVQKFQTR